MNKNIVNFKSDKSRHSVLHSINAGSILFDGCTTRKINNIINVSIDNWLFCIDEALRKSGTQGDGSSYSREDLDFLNMLLVKPSAYNEIRELLGIAEDKAVYLGEIGHIGEQDSIISIIEGERTGKLQPGDLMIIIGAGIGYVWGAGVVQWGPAR